MAFYGYKSQIGRRERKLYTGRNKSSTCEGPVVSKTPRSTPFPIYIHQIITRPFSFFLFSDLSYTLCGSLRDWKKEKKTVIGCSTAPARPISLRWHYRPGASSPERKVPKRLLCCCWARSRKAHTRSRWYIQSEIYIYISPLSIAVTFKNARLLVIGKEKEIMLDTTTMGGH